VGRAGRAAYPMPLTVEGQDDCVVGRVREDLSHPRGLNFWVVGDQLRRGPRPTRCRSRSWSFVRRTARGGPR
jgi:aspartate-semialdehyde dehydrogenase